MDEENKALNEQVEVNNQDVPPTPEEKVTEEVEQQETEPAGETEVESTETDESSKKGFSQRVRELNTRAKEAEEKAKSLEERLKELTGSSEPTINNQPFNPQIEPIIAPGEEIDAVELDKRLREREQKNLQNINALLSLRSKQQEAISRINSESNEAIRTYPELDPKSESFNKELSDAITEAVLAQTKANPYTSSVTKIVEKLMKPYKGAVVKEVGKVSENIAKQVSQTALRPTSVKSGERPDSELSTAELEKKYGMVY